MKSYLTLSLLLCLAWDTSSFSTNTQWSARLDYSTIYDDNIFESLSELKSDIAGRFLVEITGTRIPCNPFLISVNYNGGFELYSQNNVENRWINDIEGRASLPLGSHLYMGIRIHGRSKTYFKTHHGYQYYLGSPFLRWKLTSRWQGSIFYTYSILDYAEGNLYDYHYCYGGINIDLSVSSHIIWNVRFILGQSCYDRQAYEYEQVFDNTYQWFDLNQSQKDDIWEISSHIEIYKWALIQIQLSYQNNRSNSYGYSYHSPRIKVAAAKNLPWGLTIRLYWTLLMKRYTDSLQPHLQLRPDSENEENNFALIDLSKDIRENLSLRFRYGQYQNESRFQDRYYKKNIISLGFAHRF